MSINLVPDKLEVRLFLKVDNFEEIMFNIINENCLYPRLEIKDRKKPELKGNFNLTHYKQKKQKQANKNYYIIN